MPPEGKVMLEWMAMRPIIFGFVSSLGFSCSAGRSIIAQCRWSWDDVEFDNHSLVSSKVYGRRVLSL